MAKGNKLPKTLEGMIRSRARKLSLYKVFVNRNWKGAGLVTVIVSRKHTNNNVSYVACLIDMHLLGVKEATYNFNAPEYMLNELLKNAQIMMDYPLIEIPYELAHNIVYGAIDFAESIGFRPCNEWSTAKYFFEVDDDIIPFIDIEFGMDGKPVVWATPEDPMFKECVHLDRVLGEGNYIYNFANMASPDNFEDDWTGEEKVTLADEFNNKEAFRINDSLSDWDRMLAIARNIERLRPWNVLGGADIFAIEHPDNKQIYYVGFSPDSKEAVNIFILEGTRALSDFISMTFADGWKYQEDMMSIPQYMIRYMYDYTMISRDTFLQPLPLPHPSEGQCWIYFNCITPGYVPHLLSQEELLELLPIWEQILQVVIDAHFNDTYHQITDTAENGEAYFYRTFQKQDGHLHWYSDTIVPEIVEQRIGCFVSPKDIQDLMSIPKSSVQLECDWFMLQDVVKENEQMYYPTALLLVDHKDGVILEHLLLAPIPDYDSILSRIPGEIIRLLLKHKLNPDRIYVVNENKNSIIDLGVKMAGIATETSDYLPNVTEAREAMHNSMMSEMRPSKN